MISRKFLLIIGFVLGSLEMVAQVNISGVINENTRVQEVFQPSCSDCDPGCRDSIEVDDANLFAVGDRALIIQMKGASINTSNTAAGGQITDIANAGNYEFFIIDSLDLAGNFIFPEYKLIKNYDEAGQVQVIRIPNYGKNTVTVTGTLTAPTWQEAAGVGGVVALTAKKLVLNANIDVIGSGFKGTVMLVNGSPDNCSVNPTSAFTLASTATQSFTKGEGIVSNNNATNRGRAPRANGGGSGISGDSGGGGGSSYGAGGIGGRRWCNVNGAVAGGLGGVSLQTYFLEDKLFLGGAGGAGFVTTNNPSTSTDGGGIVILFVDTLVGNGFSILADGTSPLPVVPVGAPDGGGGGGGGGSVLLNVNNIVGNLTVSANGGDGQDLNTTIIHGPGGGGGGGVLLYSLATLPGTVTFGAVGGDGGVHSNGVRNGSGDGSDGGTFGLYIPVENVNYRANVDGDDVTPICDIDDDGDGIPDIQEIYSGDHDNDGIPDWADPDFCDDFFDGVSGWDCATDGLPNPTADMDGDGYPNFQDADFPYCGSFVLGVDAVCSNFDPDGDGIPSHLDLDSDNDGIPDIIEAGGVDEDGDGQVDNPIDIDGDGLADQYDNDNTDGPLGSSPCSPQPGCLDLNSYTTLPVPDSDGDGIPDYLDIDSDNDGIPDVVEAGGTDVNGDGRIDNYGDIDLDGYSDLVDASICEDSVDIDTVNNFAYATYLPGSSTGITNGNNSTGAPDNLFAQVYDTGDRLVLDFGQSYPVGTSYTLRWRRKASYGGGGTADLIVEESSNLTNWFTNSVQPQENAQVFTNSLMTTENVTRYLRIRQVTGTGDDADFDAASIGTNKVFYNVFEVCVSNTPLLVTGPDNNNDGLPDAVVSGDTDGDGIYDFRDLDSDNDGVPDVVEAGGTDADGDGYADDFADLDGDGFNDVVDGDPTNALVLRDDGPGANTANALQLTGADTDFDGRPNSVVSDDFDGDGIPNQLDLDSDGDGITDVIESGGEDTNEDGRVDGNALDTDGDGFADSVDGDVGNDGVAENSASALVRTGIDADDDGAPDDYPNANFDEDGNINMLDIDSDNDGITDIVESQTTVGYSAPSGLDSDGDGLDDAFDPDNGGTYTVPEDTDGDGDPDYVDRDSDDDTYPDLIEGHDMNGDGFADATSPANTGLSGGLIDVDGDGLLDGWDNNTASTDPTNSNVLPTNHPDVHNPGDDRDWRDNKDTDNDGISDHLDIDDDNDGVPDIVESLGYDPDGNEDGDEFPNWLDTNDDGNGGDGSLTDYTDANGDGIPDVYDFDRDGIPNHLDKDSDNDGIVDILEVGGVDINQDGEVDYPTPGVASSMIDLDNDGLADALDNVDNGSGGGEVTSGTPHPMTNTDGTGRPNYQDIDSDGDGIVDFIEAQETTEFPIQPVVGDTDIDGISNSFDPDNGGVYIVPVDTDGDGIPDYIDTDSDNDGVADVIEGWDTDGDGVAETTAAGSDTDGDGLDNSFDDVNGINGTTNPTNGGQDAYDFPDFFAGTPERDWREIPCQNGLVKLTFKNQTTSTPTFCRESSWIYYLVETDSADALNPGDSSDLLMAIEHQPFGVGANTNPFTATVSITVSSDPETSGGVYIAEDIPGQDATFVMGRYWNVNITSGSLNGFVNMRFFYNTVDADTLLATANAWNQTYAGNTNNVSGLRWFIVNSGSFDPSSADLTPEGLDGATQVFPVASGVENGIAYEEFTLTTLTGGGLAYTVGTNSVILPVELLTFEAYASGESDVTVHWVTASEINNDYFIVQRSADGLDWEDLARVEGAGTSNKEEHYIYEDANALKGVSYYRLLQVDFNGARSESEVRKVFFGETNSDVDYLIYPNPSRDIVYVRLLSDADGAYVVRNSLGQEVMQLTANGNRLLEIDGLSNGIYYFQSVDGNNASASKFVIAK